MMTFHQLRITTSTQIKESITIRTQILSFLPSFMFPFVLNLIPQPKGYTLSWHLTPQIRSVPRISLNKRYLLCIQIMARLSPWPVLQRTISGHLRIQLPFQSDITFSRIFKQKKFLCSSDNDQALTLTWPTKDHFRAPCKTSCLFKDQFQWQR